mmetsp:Transcript_48388/g.115152  ORF Transcript_48388/g.115152 Transcript_48388/m.115152 type:complete len:172 (+) Transcript_48388:14-529(+)
MSMEEGAAPLQGATARHRGSVVAVALVLLAAAAIAVPFVTSESRVQTELVSRAQKSHLQHKMIHQAEAATSTFANHDVTRAVLKAETQAKAAYAKMMGSALRVEAAAHKQGEVATERELSYQAAREQRRIAHQQARSQQDEKVQISFDNKAQERMTHAVDREMGSRILSGQ